MLLVAHCWSNKQSPCTIKMVEIDSKRYERKRSDEKTAATEQKWNRVFMQFVTAVWSAVVVIILWATYARQLCGPV